MTFKLRTVKSTFRILNFVSINFIYVGRLSSTLRGYKTVLNRSIPRPFEFSFVGATNVFTRQYIYINTLRVFLIFYFHSMQIGMLSEVARSRTWIPSFSRDCERGRKRDICLGPRKQGSVWLCAFLFVGV